MKDSSKELLTVGALRKALLSVIDINKIDQAKTSLYVEALIEKIASITDIKLDAPTITVEAPIVNVPAAEITNEITVDIPPIITEVLKAMQAQSLKKSEPVIVNQAVKYEPHDQSTGAIKYNGFVAEDGSWYIQRLSKGQQRYAKGKGKYTDSWEKRGKLTYGYIDGAEDV